MRTVIGVMGSGRPLDPGRVGGRLPDSAGSSPEHGWVLLNGGRACGVMDASAKGAHDAERARHRRPAGRGHARHLGVRRRPGAHRYGRGAQRHQRHLLDVVIALPGGAGTISEVALALQAGRTVIAVGFELGDVFREFRDRGQLLRRRAPPEEAVAEVRRAC